MDTQISVAGNATADPDLRYTPAGAPVATFTVAATSRMYDKASGSWRDGDTTFLRVAAWRAMAENVAESVRKGTRVVVIGRLRQHTWLADDGTRRVGYEIDADEVATSLRFTTVVPARATARTGRTATNSSDPGNSNGSGHSGAAPWDTGRNAGQSGQVPAPGRAGGPDRDDPPY